MPYNKLHAAWGLEFAIGQHDRMLGRAIYVQKDMSPLLAIGPHTRSTWLLALDMLSHVLLAQSLLGGRQAMNQLDSSVLAMDAMSSSHRRQETHRV